MSAEMPQRLEDTESSPSGSSSRRTSTRTIKRKRFDDEILESSMSSSSLGTPCKQEKTEPLPPQPIKAEPVEKPKEPKPVENLPEVPSEKKRGPIKSKKKKLKARSYAAWRDHGRWTPQDDFLLIQGVQQACDIQHVFWGIKFSTRFTLKELQERWHALLYDPVLSVKATDAIKELNPEVRSRLEKKALFSSDEESLLATVPAPEKADQKPDLIVFKQILDLNRSRFHFARTPHSLLKHWTLMRHCHLLENQCVPMEKLQEQLVNFSDVEENIHDKDLKDTFDETLDLELEVIHRQRLQKVKQLEQEVDLLRGALDKCGGAATSTDFGLGVIAILKGRTVQFLMKSREISIGRQTKDNQVDVDLAKEGPAWKVSRRQGMVRCRENGDFIMVNEAKRPLYVDGKAVLKSQKAKLNHNSVVEISNLRFVFLINPNEEAKRKHEINRQISGVP